MGEQQWQRYPFTKLLFDVAMMIKNNIFFVVALIIANLGGSTGFAYWALRVFAVILLIIMIYNILLWFTFRYRLSDTSIIIKKGLFDKSEQTLPFANVQNIQKQRTLIHKALGLTAIELESVDGGNEPVRMQALTAAQVAAIETALAQPLAQAPQMEEEVLTEEVEIQSHSKKLYFTPTAAELVRASFTSLSFLILIPIFLKITTSFKFIDSISSEDIKRLTTQIPLLIIGVIGILLVGIVVGIGRMFLTYWRYEIAADADKIYIRKGVFSDNHFTIAKERVQGITYTQGLLKRLLGLTSIKLITSGDMSLNEEATMNELYPYMPVKRAQQLISDILPDYVLAPPQRRLPKRAYLLSFVRPSFLWLLTSAAILYWLPQYYYIITITFIIIYGARVLNVYANRYALDEHFVQMQQGVIIKELTVTKRAKVIEIAVEQSFLQRRFNVVTLRTVGRATPIRVTEMTDVASPVADEFIVWYKARAKAMRYE